MPVSTFFEKSYQSSYTPSIARSTQLGMQEAAQSGRHSGPIPPGYQKDYAPTATPGVPILNPEQAPLIVEAFVLALEGLTLRTILTQVQALGLIGRDGKPISLATLARTLTNPFYAGLIRYEGKLYPGLHQSLVAEAHFKRVQLLLMKRRCS